MMPIINNPIEQWMMASTTGAFVMQAIGFDYLN